MTDLKYKAQQKDSWEENQWALVFHLRVAAAELLQIWLQYTPSTEYSSA